MKVIITAGGTGGHIMPAIAIAEALRERTRARILFIGTDRGMEERIARTYGLDFLALKSAGIKGKRLAGLPRTLLINLAAFRTAWGAVRAFQPDWVIGTGGYVTGMVVLAGRLAGAQCAIQEQNSIPGLTNRILAQVAQRVFLSFPDTANSFPAAKVAVCGNPLRKEFSDQAGPRGDALVIMGGSLGAHSINQAAVKAIELIRAKLKGVEIIHQTGTADVAWVREAYAASGLPVQAAAFIEDMASVFGRARLVVGRAGGISLSELSRLGIPAIMIPLPHAADNHQMFNARHVAAGGGGWIIPEPELTPARLADEITTRLSDVGALDAAGAAMRRLRLGDGAERIAEEILQCSGA